ncbi:MAG: hypothetical protein AAGJ93_02005 [Bacteroidota bacterium]
MNTVIACPTCQKKMRAPANKRIYFNCVNCGTLIHLNNGVITSTREQIEINPPKGGTGSRSNSQQRKRSTSPSSWMGISKQAILAIAALAVLIVGFFAYQFSQVEHRFYEDILLTKDKFKIALYLRGYPDGVYVAEVTRLSDNIEFKEVLAEQQRSCDLSSCNCTGLAQLTEKN